MARYRMWITPIWFVILGAFSIALAQESEGERYVEPQVDEIMRKMSESLSKAQYFTFEVTDTVDEVLSHGQKLQFSHRRKAFVSRPNRVRIDTSGDITNRKVWKDGKHITMLDKEHKVYGQIDDPGTIDQMIDMLLNKYGVTTPLADLLSDDPYTVLMANVITGFYIGLHAVGKVPCHHLAFTQEDIDWQIWIADTERSGPQKMVITYKTSPGEPQYTLQLEGAFRFSDVPLPEIFTPKIPDGYDKIDFLPLTDKEAGDTAGLK